MDCVVIDSIKSHKWIKTYSQRVGLDGSLHSSAAVSQLFCDETAVKNGQAHSTWKHKIQTSALKASSLQKCPLTEVKRQDFQRVPRLTSPYHITNKWRWWSCSLRTQVYISIRKYRTIRLWDVTVHKTELPCLLDDWKRILQNKWIFLLIGTNFNQNHPRE